MLPQGSFTRKVWAYIVRHQGADLELLVFEQADAGAGIQIPAGTVEANEDLTAALEREVFEESGLRVNSCTPLQTIERNWHGVAVRAHLFALWAPPQVAGEWVHTVTGSGEDLGIKFRSYWLPRAVWNQVYGDFKLGFPALDQFVENARTVQPI